MSTPCWRGSRRAPASSSWPIPTIRPARCCRRPRCGGCTPGLPADVLFVIDAAYAEYVGGADYEDGAALVARPRQRRHAAHLLEDLRPGGAAPRLGLWPAGGDRRAEPRARAVQRATRRPRPPASRRSADQRPCGQGAGAQRPLAALAGGEAGGGRPAAGAERRQLRAGALSRSGADGRLAAEFLNGRGILPRKMGAYGLADCLRITIGLADENQAVVEALADFAAPRGAVHRVGAR